MSIDFYMAACSVHLKDLKDPMNYGFYCPPSNNRVGKFLDEERPIKEYPLSVPIGLLEVCFTRNLVDYKQNYLFPNQSECIVSTSECSSNRGAI